MTEQYLPPSREYSACYQKLHEILEACDGGVADYDIEAIAEEAIIPHPNGEGWMLIGSDDPGHQDESFWVAVAKHVHPDDHQQDLARVLACEDEWATGSEQPRDIAAEWLEAIPNLTTGDLADWLTAGVFRPEAARELGAAGIDSYDLPYPLGYSYANGDLTLDQVRESLADII